MSWIQIKTWRILPAAAALLLPGCWNSGPEMVPVAGTVTVDGKPLTVGQVMVSPDGHRPAVGVLDQNGRFQLSSYKLGDGVVKGTHPAAVMSVEQLTEKSLRWHAPKKYANKAQSGIVLQIDGPVDDLKIDLSWQGDRHKQPFVENF